MVRIEAIVVITADQNDIKFRENPGVPEIEFDMPPDIEIKKVINVTPIED